MGPWQGLCRTERNPNHSAQPGLEPSKRPRGCCPCPVPPAPSLGGGCCSFAEPGAAAPLRRRTPAPGPGRSLPPRLAQPGSQSGHRKLPRAGWERPRTRRWEVPEARENALGRSGGGRSLSPSRPRGAPGAPRDFALGFLEGSRASPEGRLGSPSCPSRLAFPSPRSFFPVRISPACPRGRSPPRQPRAPVFPRQSLCSPTRPVAAAGLPQRQPAVTSLLHSVTAITFCVAYSPLQC